LDVYKSRGKETFIVGAAFLYMYFVGAGTAAGVATVGLITWKLAQRLNIKNIKRKGSVV
jgi:hypothetical protein